MATHAATVSVDVAAAPVTFPNNPAQRHQRLNLANISTADIWIRVDGTATAAAIAGDECVLIPPGGCIELEWRAAASAIASAAASSLHCWGRP